jgi:predicted nuclease of predicted toxin-antitoxin system
LEKKVRPKENAVLARTLSPDFSQTMKEELSVVSFVKAKNQADHLIVDLSIREECGALANDTDFAVTLGKEVLVAVRSL